MGVIGYLKIMRPEQWYKNLLVFLAIFFSFNAFNLHKLLLSFFGLVILVILSSANYIINDITDRKNDLHDISKKSRLIISGEMKVNNETFKYIAVSFEKEFPTKGGNSDLCHATPARRRRGSRSLHTSTGWLCQTAAAQGPFPRRPALENLENAGFVP